MNKEIENLLIILVLALLGGGIQALKEWFSKKQTPTPGASQAPERGGDDAEAKMRRFMEALGLPPDEVPPPQPQPPRREETATEVTGRGEEPPLMAPRAPRQHPMGPGPTPWGTTGRPSATGGEEKTSYEERMAARRRELERLKEARMARKQAAPPLSPAPAAPLSVPAPPTQRPELAAEPLFSPLLSESSPLTMGPPATAGVDVLRESFDVKIVEGGASVISSSVQPSGTPEASGSLMGRLRDPAELRRAFVLKEILGRPKALEGF